MTTTLYRQKIIFVVSILCYWQSNGMTPPSDRDSDKPLTQQELQEINMMPHFVDKNGIVYQTNFYVNFKQLGKQEYTLEETQQGKHRETTIRTLTLGAALWLSASQSKEKLPSLLAIYNQQKQEQEWKAQETATRWHCLDF